MTCDLCQSEVPYGIVTCPSCGYPQRGTAEEKAYFVQATSEQADPARAGRKKVNAAKAALVVYAGLVLLMCAINFIVALTPRGIGFNFLLLERLAPLLFVGAASIAISVGIGFWPKPMFILATALLALVLIISMSNAFNILILVVHVAVSIPIFRAIPHAPNAVVKSSTHSLDSPIIEDNI